MQEKVHSERSIYRGIIYESSKLDTMKMPRDGRIKRSSLSPGGTVRQPVEVQAQAWLDSLIPAPQPRARRQEHLVEQTTKCFQKTASASMALLLKRCCEPNSCSPNEIAVLASDAQHLQAQILISEKPPKTSEHSPGVHTDHPLAPVRQVQVSFQETLTSVSKDRGLTQTAALETVEPAFISQLPTEVPSQQCDLASCLWLYRRLI